jgi:hypothetical protein
MRIQDTHLSPKCHADNKVLRKHFVRCLANYFPKASADRQAAKQSFREKNHILNFWQETFALHIWEPGQEFCEVESCMEAIDMESPAYGGIDWWQPDSETESDDEDAE